MHARVRVVRIQGAAPAAPLARAGLAALAALAVTSARPALADGKKAKETAAAPAKEAAKGTAGGAGKQEPKTDAEPAGDPARGKAVFANFCSPCHGDKGDGKSALADSLPLRPRDFHTEKLRWGNTRRSIVETISDGRSDAMPSFKGAMPDDDIAHAAAYVWSLMPEGNRRDAPPAEASVKGKALVVGQKGKRFAPERVTMTAGEALLVVNNDDVVHDLHAPGKSSGAAKFRTQQPGQWDKVAFKEKGVFEFRCSIHPNMKLIVEVK